MSATVKTWINSLPPTCEDDDLNGFKNENNNLIIGSGQLLSTSDNQQTHKAVAHYAGVGDFYVDSGIANAYVLSVTGVQVSPPTYATGMRIRFVAGNSNTAASTINVAGLGVKPLVQDMGGAVLRSGDIQANQQTEAYYDGVSFRIISSTALAFVSYTPALSATSGSGVTYSLNQGSARRDGRKVQGYGSMNLSSVGTLSGALQINLPSTPISSGQGFVLATIDFHDNANTAAGFNLHIQWDGGPNLLLKKCNADTAGSAGLLASEILSTFKIVYSFLYWEA